MLIEKLKSERIAALKEKNTVAKNVLSVVIGEATKVDKIPTDEVVIKTIKKVIKGIEDSLNHLDPTNQNYAKLSVEKDILMLYLPKQLGHTEILGVLSAMFKFEKPTIKDIMNFFSKEFSGRVDMRSVKELAEEYIKGYDNEN